MQEDADIFFENRQSDGGPTSEGHRKQVEEEPPEIVQASLAREETFKAMKENLNFFAGISLPAEIKFPFPPLYLYLWGIFTASLFKIRDFSKFALALPRGHGKTMFIKFLVLFTVLFTRRRFVCVVCAKQDMASNIIGDVCDMLSSDNVTDLFGRWDAEIETDSKETKIFNFRGRWIILRAEGAGTTFRGVNIKNARPDVMIFDDAQTKDNAESEPVARKFISWFNGTALKAKDPTKCTFLYVGNMYKNIILSEDPVTGDKLYGCHLRNLKDNPSWRSLIVGGIKADGTALWEQLQPLAQLLSELEDDRRSQMEEVFFSEVMNDPDAYLARDFDFQKVVFNPYEEYPEPDGKFLVIDPSLGKEWSDEQIVGEFWIFDGMPVFQKIHYYQCSAPKLVQDLLMYALHNKIPLIVAESYAYQETLVQWFNEFINNYHIEGIFARGISRGMKTKVSAISDYFQILQSNEQYLHKLNSVRSLVFDQIRSYDKTRKDNRDDILDVGYYANQVLGDSDLRPLAFILEGEYSQIHSTVIESTGPYVRQTTNVR